MVKKDQIEEASVKEEGREEWKASLFGSLHDNWRDEWDDAIGVPLDEGRVRA